MVVAPRLVRGDVPVDVHTISAVVVRSILLRCVGCVDGDSWHQVRIYESV